MSAIIGGTTTSYTYDTDGNRLTCTQGSATDAYGYDSENRLVSLSKNTSGGAGSYSYQYDYRARRISRTENRVTTAIVFSGGTSVREYNGTAGGAPAVQYVRGSDYGGGIGGILYTLRGSSASYTHENRRGDVIAKTDCRGSLTYQAQYEGFGKRTQEQGATADRQKANTKDEDPTGLVDEGFRYLDLDTGEFITRDPAGFVDGPNEYTYVVQNPWTKFDPEGLDSEDADGDGKEVEANSGTYTPEDASADAERNDRDGVVGPTGQPVTPEDEANAHAYEQWRAANPPADPNAPPQLSSTGSSSSSSGSFSATGAPGQSMSGAPLDPIVPTTGSSPEGESQSETKDQNSATVGSSTPPAPQKSPDQQPTAQGQTSAATTRLPQDAAVNPTPPAALPTNRPIGSSPTQNAQAHAQVQSMQRAGYTDIRVNQQQVNAQGQRVGINRPDVQGTNPSGVREYHEYDRESSKRGSAHQERTQNNDPDGSVTQHAVD